MKYTIKAIVEVTMELEPNGSSRHIETAVDMQLSENVNESHYLDENDYPTKRGIVILDYAFSEGLIAVNQMAYIKELGDSAKMLKKTITHIEEGVFRVGNLSTKSSIAK